MIKTASVQIAMEATVAAGAGGGTGDEPSACSPASDPRAVLGCEWLMLLGYTPEDNFLLAVDLALLLRK